MKKRLKLALLWVARAIGLFALARRLMRGRLRILCYHGFELADETRFRSTLFITRDEFSRRLEALKRYGCSVLGLQEAVERLYAGRLPDLPVVITIDDGWYSTYAVGLPMLRDRGLPVTLYVTSYYVVNPFPIFRLAIQYMFWKTRRDEVDLRGLAWGGGERVQLTNLAERDRLAWLCIRHGEACDSQAERNRIAQEMGERLDVPFAEVHGTRVMSLMTGEEVTAAAQAGVDIQLHTHRHTFPATDAAGARMEIDDNRRALAPLVAQPLRHFCYPSGVWSPATFGLLDELQIGSSTTCEPGLNDGRTPRHALRRFLDGAHVRQLEFEADLCGFLELVRLAKRRVVGHA